MSAKTATGAATCCSFRWFERGTNLHQLLDVLVIERHSQDEAQWAQ